MTDTIAPSKRALAQLRRAAAGEPIRLRQGSEVLLNGWVVMKWPNKLYELTDKGRAVLEQINARESAELKAEVAKCPNAPHVLEQSAPIISGVFPCPFCSDPVQTKEDGNVEGIACHSGRCKRCGRRLEVTHSPNAIHIVVVTR